MPPLGTRDIVWTGGAGGGSCLVSDQPLPAMVGWLRAGQGCEGCCETALPDLLPGAQAFCDDQGNTDGCTAGSRRCPLVGVTGVNGFSPLSLSYTVNLSFLPADARAVRVRVQYGLAPFPGYTIGSYQIGDSWSPAQMSLNTDWSPAGIAAVNAAMRSSTFGANASCGFVTIPAGGQAGFTVVTFDVDYCTSVSG